MQELKYDAAKGRALLEGHRPSIEAMLQAATRWCCWHATQRHKHSTPAQIWQLRRLQQCAVLSMGPTMLAAGQAAVPAAAGPW